MCIYKGFCLKNGSFAIIMRLYSCSLAAALTRAPAQCLPLPLALKYGMDVAKGLVELHRLGVICAGACSLGAALLCLPSPAWVAGAAAGPLRAHTHTPHTTPTRRPQARQCAN